MTTRWLNANGTHVEAEMNGDGREDEANVQFLPRMKPGAIIEMAFDAHFTRTYRPSLLLMSFNGFMHTIRCPSLRLREVQQQGFRDTSLAQGKASLPCAGMGCWNTCATSYLA